MPGTLPFNCAKSANEGDFRLLTAELGKARTDADKRELVKQFKKLIRNREGVATTVSSAAAVKKPAAKARPSASNGGSCRCLSR